jgi:GT2 family glycosyltransferase
MAGPQISVVVPTRNRPARLRALLASLLAQSFPRECFEVIVVDDAGDPGAAQAPVQDAAAQGLAARCETLRARSGPAVARNAGWRAAGGAVIAFTDDDCVAPPDWLQALATAAAAHPNAIVQGPTQPDPAERHALGLLARTVTVEGLGPQYETCNIAYPRPALEALGGFDEGFGAAPAAEDTDLAWRAIEHGYTTVFAPDALMHHAVERIGIRGSLRVARRWEAATRIFAEHPQTRTILYRGVFWNVWHYLVWRSLLSALGPAWLRRLILARHLLELRRRARRERAGAWVVPYLLVHDLVECWAVARGAVRYRTFVL